MPSPNPKTGVLYLLLTGYQTLIRQTIQQREGKGVIGVQQAGIRNHGYYLKIAWPLNAENKEELAQRKGNTQTKYTRRAMLMGAGETN